MLNYTNTILLCSRIFSLPMTILSWLVIFVFALIDSGNVWYGILSLFGICFAHLGTNILDDYIDYKHLIKQVDFDKTEYLKNSQKTKCRYLISGQMKENDVLMICGIYFGLAFLIGLFLFIKCGMPVIYFALAGGLIGLLYPFISRICLSELAVALSYGPLLFCGVYYVMTGTLDKVPLIVSIPTMIMTVILLYIHTVMDFDYDLKENHLTIANRFDSQLDSLIVLKFLLILSYLSVILLCVLDIADWQIFISYLTIPLAVDLYKSMADFACLPEEIPERKWFHHPMENYKKLKQREELAFMFRIYQSRNLMIYFSLFLTLGIILSLAL